MKSHRLVALIAVIQLGCSSSPPPPAAPALGQVARFAVTPLTEAMIGNWDAPNALSLQFKKIDDQIELSGPSNEQWRVDITEAETKDDALHFVLKNQMLNNASHPLNGVPCQCVARTEGETLVVEMKSRLMPQPRKLTLKRSQ